MSQVHWYPGHMAKAMRLIEEQVKIVDFVIECRDARAPISTSNPALNRVLNQKRRLVILTKSDLAEPGQNEKWVKHLESEGHVVLLLDVLKDPVKKLILEKTEIVMKEKWERDKRRGIRPRPARALIVGVPNVGKSSIINKIVSKKAASVENRPGVTQALKLVKVSDKLEIVDTPGVLWPKFETEEMGIHIALIGSIKETGYPLDLVTDFAKDYFIEAMPQALISRYQLDGFDNFYEQIARFRGMLEANNLEDVEKAKLHFLSDVQNGKVARITWDRL